MTLLGISFLAGCLTVLAPCILPLLPVVVGSSARARNPLAPYVVIFSLGVSIILFTFLLKVSTAFIAIPASAWAFLSGGILAVFGLTLVFPELWERVTFVKRLSVSSNKTLGDGYSKKSFWGDVLIGASLGPVFSTCSPTYFVILATVLPASFLLGSLYLFAYVLGLSLVLLLISLLGDKLTARLNFFADSRGYFKKGLGLMFIIVGVLITTGYDKKIETAILNSGYFDVTKYEQKLLEKISVTEEAKEPELAVKQVAAKPIELEEQKYIEFVNPSGYVNTGGEKIAMSDFVGKQVILVEVMTYSCINCKRTFPYLNDWHQKYKNEGLTVIGLHTPEFAFEKKIENVEKAMQEAGITFPIVLDNNYETWNAYGNQFWPRLYLIDIKGNIVYDHIGEGGYETTEAKIIELLKERQTALGVE